MARFCRKCGRPIETDAKFCMECGNVVSAQGAKAPEPETNQPAKPKSKPFMRRALLLVAAVVVITLAWGAWNYFDSPRPTEKNFIQAIEKHAARVPLFIDRLTCDASLPYQTNPLRVDYYDTRPKAWMDSLVAAGVYNAPEQQQAAGLLYRVWLTYSLTEQGKQSIRSNMLCVASGIKVTRIIAHQEQRKRGSHQVVRVRFAYEYQSLAPWAQRPEVQQILSKKFRMKDMEQQELLVAAKDGWQVTGDALLDRAYGAEDRKSAGTDEQGFISRMLRALGDIFSGSGPEAVAQSFYEAIERGDIDKAQSLLSEQVYVLADKRKIRAALLQQSEQARHFGGISKIETKMEEHAAYARVSTRVVFGNGREARERLKLVKEDGAWKIAPDK